jgi:transcriptional regulator with XRE-family HTH domain
MSDGGAPARPWYHTVIEQAAIRGWSVHELARRSGVGRPTIYRWRDGSEVPQARPVGLVADVLGIPRERAVRLPLCQTSVRRDEPVNIGVNLASRARQGSTRRDDDDRRRDRCPGRA